MYRNITKSGEWRLDHNGRLVRSVKRKQSHPYPQTESLDHKHYSEIEREFQQLTKKLFAQNQDAYKLIIREFTHKLNYAGISYKWQKINKILSIWVDEHWLYITCTYTGYFRIDIGNNLYVQVDSDIELIEKLYKFGKISNISFKRLKIHF